MTLPRHVAIIMDGNRRFAKRLMEKPWKGHEWGAKKVEKVWKWARELGIKELTLYVLSLQNFNRPKKEFDYLMDILKKNLIRLLKEEKKLSEEKIRINVAGKIELLPEDIQELIKKLAKKTEKNSEYTLNLAIAYGGQEEIIEAIKQLSYEIREQKISLSDITREYFLKKLYIKNEPDLIIRTGGEKRLSNFLLYQCSYSELIFIDKMWPEFEKEDFINCIEEFKKRKRRFGR